MKSCLPRSVLVLETNVKKGSAADQINPQILKWAVEYKMSRFLFQVLPLTDKYRTNGYFRVVGFAAPNDLVYT